MSKMKFVFLVMLLLGTDIFASQHGFKVGINYSDIGGKSDLSFKKGINFGIIETIKISDKIDIQPEFLYSSKGGLLIMDWINESGEKKGELEVYYKFVYIDFPVLCKYNIRSSGTKKANILLGPKISFLHKADWGTEKHEELRVPTQSYDIRESVNNIDISLTGGFDYEFGLLNFVSFIDFRYCLSLKPIYKESDWEKSHHHLFSLSIGMKY